MRAAISSAPGGSSSKLIAVSAHVGRVDRGARGGVGRARVADAAVVIVLAHRPRQDTPRDRR